MILSLSSFCIVQATDALRSMRLNVSGSAALPDTVMAAWKDLSGQVCNMEVRREGAIAFASKTDNI